MVRPGGGGGGADRPGGDDRSRGPRTRASVVGDDGRAQGGGDRLAAFDARIGSGLFGNGGGMRRVLTLIGPESGALQLMLTTWKHSGCVLFGPPDVAAMAAVLPVLQPTGLLASRRSLPPCWMRCPRPPRRPSGWSWPWAVAS